MSSLETSVSPLFLFFLLFSLFSFFHFFTFYFAASLFPHHFPSKKKKTNQ